MTTSDSLRSDILSGLTEYFSGLGVAAPEIALDTPDHSEHGDITNSSSLKYAKELGRSPVTIAQEGIRFLQEKNIAGIAKIEFAAPGYINIFVDATYLRGVISDIISAGDSYGHNERFSGQKWVIEHTSPNPNKAMHLGHLRNNLIGMGITRLLELSGAEVVCDCIDNNRGIAIAKLMWGFLEHQRKDGAGGHTVEQWHAHKNEWLTPEEAGELPDVFVTNSYVMGEKDFRNNPEIEAKVRQMVVDWENNDPLIRELWKHVLEYSYEGIQRTLKRLGNRWDKVWHEHEHYQEGKDAIEAGLAKHIFVRLEDGAVLTNLEAYNLPDTILLKKDGTSLYITQDIALTTMKKALYKADRLVWVIGPEQALAMKQLFAVCEQLGIGTLSNFTHVSYGYVGLKTDSGFKKMSSRDGTSVMIDDVLDSAKNTIRESRFGSLNPAEAEELSEKLAVAAVKFSLLKIERTQDMAFDISQATEMQGDTGIYVMYTYVRLISILEKAAAEGLKIEPAAIDCAAEVVKKMFLYNVAIAKSAESFSLHHIAQFLLQLCAEFNSWYSKEKILDGSDAQSHKLAVVKALSQIIKNGLAILGIPVVQKM